jgi:Na+/melibiose symporter-like transporter
MRAPSWWPERGLWRHPEFLRLWAAQIVSAFGSRITRTALPVLAVLALRQEDAALGALSALTWGPSVAVALVAGGYVDRGTKRRILVACDLIRAALVASLPIAAWTGSLTMVHIYVVAAGTGAASALFRITDGALLPILVGTPHLAEGNAKLEATEATAEISGPAAAGVLIGVLGAPIAVLIDAVSYVWSALFLGALRTREIPHAPDPARASSVSDDLAIGLRAVFGPPVIRRLIIAEMALAITGGFFSAMYALYCLRDLDLSTTMFGIVIGFGGVGALIGASLARALVRAWGLGWTMIVMTLLAAAGNFMIPAAGALGGGGVAMIALLIAHQLISDGAQVAYQVNAVTLRQTLLPHDQLGRANAAVHACTMALVLIAALGGGALGSTIGTRTALVIGPVIGLIAPIVLIPLHGLRKVPAPTMTTIVP